MAIMRSAGSRVGALLFWTLPIGVPIGIPSVAGAGGRAVKRRHGVSGSDSVGLAVPMPEDLDGLLLEVDVVPVGHVRRVQDAIGVTHPYCTMRSGRPSIR